MFQDKTPLGLLSRVVNQPRTVTLGMISGTSMDGVDISVITSDDKGVSFELIELHSFEYPNEIRQKLLNLNLLDVRGVSDLHAELGDFFGEISKQVIESLRVKGIEADLIGSHGQTVYHHSSVKGSIPSTLQLADGDRIAVKSGLLVVSDFRSKDLALGGQGAPLTPYGDWIMFKNLRGSAAILNIGGIANLTFLSKDSNRVTGFDTGPGNAPLDRIVRLLTSGKSEFDEGGELANQGTIDYDFVNHLLKNDEFVLAAPPKSTGFEMYGDSYVSRISAEFGRFNNDFLATMTRFVAETVALSIKQYQPFTVKTLVVAGGGAFNLTLMKNIKDCLNGVEVLNSDNFNVPAKARESMSFGIMAHHALLGYNTSIEAVTGAKEGAILGKLSFPH